MRLLRFAEVEASSRDCVFHYSRVTASIVACLVLGACAGLFYQSYSAHWKFGYYFAAVILLFVFLMRRFITARFRPSNWLVRMNDLGIFVQFRSYLNYHLPADDLTVVFIGYQEIRSARLIHERVQVPDTQGEILRSFAATSNWSWPGISMHSHERWTRS